jgi:hypothetical protein
MRNINDKKRVKTEEKKNVYNTNETAGLINVQMLQSISTENDSTNFSNHFCYMHTVAITNLQV